MDWQGTESTSICRAIVESSLDEVAKVATVLLRKRKSLIKDLICQSIDIPLKALYINQIPVGVVVSIYRFQLVSSDVFKGR